MYHGEKLNSISHLAGAVLALMGLGALLAVGIQAGDTKLTLVFAVDACGNRYFDRVFCLDVLLKSCKC